jgi:hypothetical protein
MCLAMSVTPPDTFERYREFRVFKTRVERIVAQLAREDPEEVALVLEACGEATDDEFAALDLILQREPLDFGAVLAWARAVLWEHEEWPGPF